MSTPSVDPRTHILACGERLIAQKGFVGVGLAEILTTAGVPKGSFYHYFASKEGFGEALLLRYLERYLARLDVLLGDDGLPARDRLMRYWSFWNVTQCGIETEGQGVRQQSSKCLIVKLSAEVADISEPMRIALRDGTDHVVSRIATCIDEGRADGSIGVSESSAQTALTLYQLWLGASLLAKLRRNGSPFEHATLETQRLLGVPVNPTR